MTDIQSVTRKKKGYSQGIKNASAVQNSVPQADKATNASACKTTVVHADKALVAAAVHPTSCYNSVLLTLKESMTLLRSPSSSRSTRSGDCSRSA